jgi:TfoX/Sxy family transcriptional regulator of competence genes
MKFEKADPEAVSMFDAIAPGAEVGVEKRKMFGYPCRFLNGNMFMGLHNNNMILRLSEKDRATFLKVGGKVFEPVPGRVMREYMVVPNEMIKLRDVKVWIEKSLAFASSLPPKKKKSKK